MASAPTSTPLMTAEEFLALPDDGKQRWLIRGHLRERDNDGTRRNRFHSKTEARIAQLISNWRDSQPEPRGEVHSGEAGFILREDPQSIVGVDVAYVSPQTAQRQDATTTLMRGTPLLAVEILSPSDTVEDTTEKVKEFLDAHVALVWLVDPHFHTVQVFEQDKEPVMFNVEQTITAEPHLPGFSVPVKAIFE